MALLDQFTLAADVTFQNRVEQAILEAAVAVAAEADTVGFHGPRMRLATKVLENPSTYAPTFAKAVATDDAVATAAGVPPVQGSVTDAQINNAVSGMWNSMAGARDASR